jgi:hypothetical protein
MRTVVVCCDAGWQNWASLVRTRALDLYRPGLEMEFWDCANKPGPDASLWGNWPRFFSSGGPAVIADLDEQITRLTLGESLAVLFVYGTPYELATPIIEDERRFGPPHLANLQTLRERVARLARLQGNPVLRIGLFRCDPTQATEAKAASLIVDKLFDGVFFIGMCNSSAKVTQFRPQQFDAVRLVADIARDVDAQGVERARWHFLRYQPPDDRVFLYWLHPPPPPRGANQMAPPGLGNPSGMIASAMVAYFEKQTRERGLDQSGETLKDFTELEETIAAQVDDADNLVSLRATELATADQEAAAADKLFGDVGEDDQWSPPQPPPEPLLDAARKWREDLNIALTVYLDGRHKRIRNRQNKDDPYYRRLDIEAEKAQRLIHAVSTGLTGNAYGRIDEILADLKHQRDRFVAMAEGARAAISAITEEERGATVEPIASSEHKEITWFRRSDDLRHSGETFLSSTANCLNLGWMSRAAWAISAILYVLFALHTQAMVGDASAIRVLLLGLSLPTPEWTKPALFATTVLLLFGVCHYVKRNAKNHWEASRNDTRACADSIASIIRRVDFYTIRYTDATAVMSWLARIERRLRLVKANIADNVLRATIDQIRDAGVGKAMGEDEQRAFENALGAQLQREPIERWIKVILSSIPLQPTHQVAFDSPGVWTGELIITSQLRPDPGLRVKMEARIIEAAQQPP